MSEDLDLKIYPLRPTTASSDAQLMAEWVRKFDQSRAITGERIPLPNAVNGACWRALADGRDVHPAVYAAWLRRGNIAMASARGETLGL